MKTVVYVDGFNLYYRALKNSRHKWLNLQALCQASLPRICNIVAINYYTARVSGRPNPDSARDQNIYLEALKTLPHLQIHLGNFQVTNKWMFLAQPIEFRPPGTIPNPVPVFARVIKTEEKGSDVNLGTHLVRDAFTGAFEHAVIVTNDTDLREPLRIVVQEAGLPVTLLTPTVRPTEDLKRLAIHIRHLRPYLGVSQFPETLTGQNGQLLTKPVDWCKFRAPADCLRAGPRTLTLASSCQNAPLSVQPYPLSHGGAHEFMACSARLGIR
jgi:uncharacterized LabA/DUF88 family protein